jgi:homogentisate 1,2-dioxygenase
MAFMFETRNILCPTRHALSAPTLQRDYQDCWLGIPEATQPERA